LFIKIFQGGKKMKTLLRLVLGITLLFTITACGSNSSNSSSDSSSKDTSSSGGSSSEEKFKIQIGYVTTDNEDDPYHIAASLFKEKTEAATDGQVEIELFPNGQLGQEREMIEGMQIGTIEGGVITNAYLSGFDPKLQVFDLPFLFGSYEEAHAVADGEVGQMLIDGLEEKGIIGLAWAEGGFRVMINNERPINVPEDSNGIKFRSMENPLYMEMFKSIGANPTPMSWGEVFTAVQQKTVDGLEAPVAVLYQSKYYEVAKYLSLTNHTYSPLLISVSKQKWDSIPSDLQEMVRAAAQEAAKEQREKNQEVLKKLIEGFKAEGVEVNEVEDPTLFKEKVEHIYDEYQEIIGEEVMSKVLN
jgi:tripartite ATP-independent transporter DctP family solute receptor